MKAALISALLVGSGGFAGAVLRYGLSGLVQRASGLTSFPSGTLFVNLLGCLAIGALAGLADSRQLLDSDLRKLVLIGVLGGFTTFSTFAYESFAMLRDSEYLRVAGNTALHVVLGVGLVWVGYAVTAR